MPFLGRKALSTDDVEAKKSPIALFAMFVLLAK
jgi:hypothetical protein